MIEGMEKYVGLKIKKSYIETKKLDQRNSNYILTRPYFYSAHTHVNMKVIYDENFVVIDYEGDKCYSYSTSLYNRSSPVRDGHFTKRDLAYLRGFVKDITE